MALGVAQPSGRSVCKRKGGDVGRIYNGVVDQGVRRGCDECHGEIYCTYILGAGYGIWGEGVHGGNKSSDIAYAMI